jgi:NTE family protein
VSTTTRALVLGGGGAAGNAWEIGVVAGLAEAGLDVTGADLVVGTSAGATAAAQLTSGAHPAELLAAVLAEPSGRGRAPSSGAPAPRTVGAQYLEATGAVIASARDAADMRRRLGAAALEAQAASDPTPQWRATVAARLPGLTWPQQRLLVVAVDAHTGEPVVLDRHSGVDLVDAVAASSANGYTVGARTYLNGGYRRNENADLAAGCGRVLVLSPFGGRSRHPVDWGMQLAAQVDELRAGGSRVETVFPDGSVRDLFDAGALDPATRAPAARAGHLQGTALAGRLRAFWAEDDAH